MFARFQIDALMHDDAQRASLLASNMDRALRTPGVLEYAG